MGDARAARAARLYIAGGSRRRSRAGAFAHSGGLLLFSVAGRRPCLASSLWSPLRAERGSGEHGATGDARATRAQRARRARTSRVALAAAVEQGRSRAVLVYSPSSFFRACRSARAAPSLHPRRRASRSPRAGAQRTQRTAGRARRMGVRAPRALGARGPCSRVRGKQPS